MIAISNIWVFFLCTPYIKDKVINLEEIEVATPDNEDIKVEAEKLSTKARINKLRKLEERPSPL